MAASRPTSPTSTPGENRTRVSALGEPNGKSIPKSEVIQVGFEPTCLLIKSQAHGQALRLDQSTPTRTRTEDTRVKSPLLCQLSYRSMRESLNRTGNPPLCLSLHTALFTTGSRTPMRLSALAMTLCTSGRNRTHTKRFGSSCATTTLRWLAGCPPNREGTPR